MYMTKRQEERFRRNCELYEDYMSMKQQMGDLVTRWKLAGALAEKYGINPMTANNIIVRMGEYFEQEAQNTNKC